MVQVLSTRGIHFDFPVSVVGDQSVPGQGLSGQAAHLSSAPAFPGFPGFSGNFGGQSEAAAAWVKGQG